MEYKIVFKLHLKKCAKKHDLKKVKKKNVSKYDFKIK